MQNLPARLEQLRGSQTQKAFAERLGLPLNTYTNWVRGINKPLAEQLAKICIECGVTIEWLLGASDDNAPIKTPKPVVTEPQTRYDQAAELHNSAQTLRR